MVGLRVSNAAFLGQIGGAVVLSQDTLSYVAAVEAAGGTVSTAARNLLDTAMTTTFGGLKYADYKAKLRFFWCPLSNFAGVSVPTKGSNFTSVGFVSGDYSLGTGLTVSGTKYLNSNVVGTAEANDNTTLMSGNPLNAPGALIGYSFGGSLLISSGNADSYKNTGNGRITHNTNLIGTYFSTRRSATEFRVHRNKEQLGIQTGTDRGTLAALNIYIGQVNQNPNPNFGAGRVDAASFGAALTQAEQDSFSDMLSAIRTGRASL